MTDQESKLKTQQPQSHYLMPDEQSKMAPMPNVEDQQYQGTGKLQGKVAIITGGDSGIGQSVASLYAKEGADVTVVYYEADEDAKTTKDMVEEEGRQCLLMAGDVGDSAFCDQVVEDTVNIYGHLDILVNNAGEQHVLDRLDEISDEQIDRTFRTNIFSMFYLTRSAMPHLNKGSAIINTTSITAYKGEPFLLDYSATKGAIVSFTRSLSQNKEVLGKGIRVNAVAPGPIWTPLIPSTFPEDKLQTWGSDVPMQRPGQPNELGPAYVFLASPEASYISGQVIHVNGGVVLNG